MTQNDVIVVDANVWLDYLFGDRPGNKDAARFLAQARCCGVSLVIPPHEVCNVFYIIQSRLKAQNKLDGKLTPEEAAASARAAAWAAIDLIMELATVGPSDQMDAIIAAKNRSVHGDYEDNLVVACAMRTKARWLVTNDRQLIQHCTVAALTPEDACAYLED